MTSGCLLSPLSNKEHLSISDVYFAHLSETQIKTYGETGEPYDKAEAYGIQDLAGVFVERIEGRLQCYHGLTLTRYLEPITSLFRSDQN